MPKRMTQQEFVERVKQYTNDTVDVISTYTNRRTKVWVKCKTCGHEWEISPTILMPNSMRQYSFIGCPECKYDIVYCDYCGKQFKRLKSALKDSVSGLHYCSKECGNRHKNEMVEKNNSTAYRRNAFKYYEHKCAICGYNECVEVLEVHHIDENHNNNELDNLIILCPICHKKITMHLTTLPQLQDYKNL